jgi:hypothetical protein
MDQPLFLKFDPVIAGAYALLVVLLVVIYRQAKSTRARLIIYGMSVILVLAFLLLFAPR